MDTQTALKHAILVTLAATKISQAKPLAIHALPTLTLYRMVSLGAIAWWDTLTLADTQTALCRVKYALLGPSKILLVKLLVILVTLAATKI